MRSLQNAGWPVAVGLAFAAGTRARTTPPVPTTPKAEPGPNVLATPADADSTCSPADPVPQVTDAQSNQFLQERGLGVPLWWHRILLSGLLIVAVICLIAAFLTQLFSLGRWWGVGLGGFAGASFATFTYLVPQRFVVTEHAKTGAWVSKARHGYRWVALAGPRLRIAIVALFAAIIAVPYGASDERSSFGESFYAGLAGTLFVVAGAAFFSTFWEYRHQLRILRRNVEPVLLALELREQVDVLDVARLLLSLSTGVATVRNDAVPIIDASRAQSAIALYSHTRSPESIASVIEDASIRLGLRKAVFEKDLEHLATRPTGVDALKDQNLATTFLGHPRATSGTRNLVFAWIASDCKSHLQPAELHASLAAVEK